MRLWIQRWADDDGVQGYTLHATKAGIATLVKLRSGKVTADPRKEVPAVPAGCAPYAPPYRATINDRTTEAAVKYTPYGMWRTGELPTCSITRSLKVEIVKAIGIPWDDLRTMLHVQRRLVSQMLRVGMDARIACGVVGADVVKAKVAPEARGQFNETMAYQAMLRELERQKAQRDEALAKQKPQRGGQKSAAQKAREAMDIAGGTTSALGQVIQKDYAKRSSFNSLQPIPVRKQETSIRMGDDGRVVVDLRLLDKQHPRTVFVVRAGKGSAWNKLRQIAAGKFEYGACQIIYDERRHKWFIHVAWEQVMEPPLPIDRSCAIVLHRGCKEALTILATTGAYYRINAGHILSRISKIEARIRNARAIPGEILGRGAKGHGKARRFEHYEVLSGKRQRILKTYFQQLAALVIKHAKNIGAGLLVVEDYGGIGPNDDAVLRRVFDRFPLYMLKQCIEHAAEAAGIAVEEVPSVFISTTCPACGSQDDRQHNRRTGTFHCHSCSFERPANFVAALHMARLASLDMTVWNERFAKVDALRKTVEEALHGEEPAEAIVGTPPRRKKKTPKKRTPRRGNNLGVTP